MLIVEMLDKSEVPRRNRRAQERADPINPMVSDELRGSHCRTEATRWVEGTASIIYTYAESDTYVKRTSAMERGNIPPNIATKSANPIPSGARNVSLLFSAASMSTTKTSSAVINISMKTP